MLLYQDCCNFFKTIHCRKRPTIFWFVLDLQYDNTKEPRYDIDTYSKTSLKRKKFQRKCTEKLSYVVVPEYFCISILFDRYYIKFYFSWYIGYLETCSDCFIIADMTIIKSIVINHFTFFILAYVRTIFLNIILSFMWCRCLFSHAH